MKIEQIPIGGHYICHDLNEAEAIVNEVVAPVNFTLSIDPNSFGKEHAERIQKLRITAKHKGISVLIDESSLIFTLKERNDRDVRLLKTNRKISS